MSTVWTLINVAAAAVPAVITLLAVRIGSRQAREFHDRTGDSNFLLSLTALSRFHDKDESEVRPPQGEAWGPADRISDKAAPQAVARHV
jgi:hypothetical protein